MASNLFFHNNKKLIKIKCSRSDDCSTNYEHIMRNHRLRNLKVSNYVFFIFICFSGTFVDYLWRVILLRENINRRNLQAKIKFSTILVWCRHTNWIGIWSFAHVHFSKCGVWHFHSILCNM